MVYRFDFCWIDFGRNGYVEVVFVFWFIIYVLGSYNIFFFWIVYIVFNNVEIVMRGFNFGGSGFFGVSWFLVLIYRFRDFNICCRVGMRIFWWKVVKYMNRVFWFRG